jgi:trans-2,3-dihydro-3-hydroxyanthranilate isomerase
VKSYPFFIVDVFAETALSGNPLAVFTESAGLESTDMQRLAREINFSETTFVTAQEPRAGGYDVRIFTPREEVPFAGHPTLGTAFLVRQELVRRAAERVVLNLKSGPVPVDFEYQGTQVERLWMHQPAPTFGSKLERSAVAACLGLPTSDIRDDYPVQEVSTGLPFVIIPLTTLEAVKRAAVRREQYFQLIEALQSKALLVFALASYAQENHLNVRVFADYYGTPEDPATGSANGALAAYLARYRCTGGAAVDVRVEQGYEIGRRSLLYLRANDRGSKIDVSVGGQVHSVASGAFHLG